MKHILTIVIILGSLLRVTLGVFSPPNNTYDNHLEAISKYINNESRPKSHDCWQCYQPPLYYLLAKKVYVFSYGIFNNHYYSWKSVQFINIILSICNLFIISVILKTCLYRNKILVAVVVSFLSFYPRDIYASVMITNDYLLVFLSSLSVLFYIRFFKNETKFNYLLLCIFVLFCSFTKQHGLIMLGLPFFVAIKSFYRNVYKIYNYRFTFSIVTIMLSLLEEIRSYFNTGFIIVSNQNFFDYTNNQLPGIIDDVSFTSFYFRDLLTSPFLSNNTLFSFWTEIFARTWFDYEWRFISPEIPSVQFLSTPLYFIGLIVTIFIFIGALRYVSDLMTLNKNYIILVFICLCFITVPILQTYRFPYFSSMKSQFFLPGISIICMSVYYLILKINLNDKYLYFIISLFLSFGFYHILFIIFNFHISLQNLNGPLWQFPYINLI